jgi:hypothetical protein
MIEGLLLILLALPAAGADASDDPMIRWDCDPEGNRLVLEMVRPPVAHVTEREHLLLSGTAQFEQCRLAGASWSLLVDIIEYDSGRCEPLPDTIVSLLRNGRPVLSRVLIGENCVRRPVLSAARISENGGRTSLELCAAERFGAEGRCEWLQLQETHDAIDNEAIAAHAMRGAP